MKPTYGWIVLAPKQKAFDILDIAVTKQAAIDSEVAWGKPWPLMRKDGYRCVKVKCEVVE